MMLAIAMSAVLPVEAAPTPLAVVADSFELPPASQQIPAPSLLAPRQPRNLDVRTTAVDAPEAEWQLAYRGPVLVVGAMGGRRSGMPKLAHVALDWSF